MKKRVDLSIIILNYNIRQLLRNCLVSLEKAKRNNYVFETIVVDNASTDDSCKMVKKEFPWVMLISSKKNLGFAGGNNLGIPKSSGRYILFLNPDTVVPPDTLAEMVEFMDKESLAGAATCWVELVNGKLDEACHRGFPTPWNAFCHFSGLEKIFPKSRLFSGYLLGYLSLKKIHQIDSGVGAFLMVRRSAGESVGWWDTDYFWYGEDLDFCYRLKEKNWQIYFFPNVKIIHHKGASSGIKKHSREVSTATRATRIWAAKRSTEAMRIFYRKHYSGKYPKIIYYSVMVGISLIENLRVIKFSLK